MKLVEILAKKLSEWPKGVHAFAQDQCEDVYPWTGVPEYDDNKWITADDCDLAMGSYISLDIDLAEDYATDIVTRAQWQAERDRQKGGDWKRHRAGRNQPVMAGVRVEVKLRCGDIQQGNAHEFIWLHSECDVAANIMSYRVISQPQAGEVEVKKTNMGTLSYKVEIDTTEATQAIDELAAKWDQVDGPLLWRDTVNELDAYIEEFTREREALINRLALEGFALIPAMTAVMGVADAIIPIEDWQVGDIIQVVRESNESCAEAGRCYPITSLDEIEPRYELDGNYYPKHEDMKFIRRP